MSLAWHAAAFQRAKQLPRIKTVLRQLEEVFNASAGYGELAERQMAAMASLGVPPIEIEAAEERESQE